MKPLQFFTSYFTEHRKEDYEKDIALYEEIKKDLMEKLPQILEHFDEYEESSVQYIVNEYAQRRHRFMKSAKYYRDSAEKIQLEFRPEAGECLKYILQKKFFDAQCLWRAGEVTLPGIDTTYDFHQWEHDLWNCPFIDPITEQEVSMLINYLEEHPEEAVMEKWYYDWQGYEYLKLCFLEREGMTEEFYEDYICVMIRDTGIPPWYDYYDSVMGRKYLAKVDVKKPKESYYRQLYAQHKKKTEEEQAKQEGKPLPPKKEMPERKPRISEDMSINEAIDELVDNFEPREMKKLYQAYCLVERKDEEDEEDVEEDDYEEDFAGDEDEDNGREPKAPSEAALNAEIERVWHELHYVREPFPIEMHDDWRQALIIAFREYKIKKIIKAIPAAYDDYLMRLETGVGFEKPEREGMAKYMLDSKKEILEGRKLAGEPGDFNY